MSDLNGNLVVEEDAVGLVDDTFDAQRLAERRHHVVLDEHRQDHERLDQQLPVLGLRDGVQHRLHLLIEEVLQITLVMVSDFVP